MYAIIIVRFARLGERESAAHAVAGTGWVLFRRLSFAYENMILSWCYTVAAMPSKGQGIVHSSCENYGQQALVKNLNRENIHRVYDWSSDWSNYLGLVPLGSYCRHAGPSHFTIHLVGRPSLLWTFHPILEFVDKILFNFYIFNIINYKLFFLGFKTLKP